MTTPTQSTKTKLKTLTIEGINNRVKIILIIIGALTFIGDSAPYVHLAFPVKANEIIQLEQQYDQRLISQSSFNQKRTVLKEKYEVFGFSTLRRFLFAIGVAVSVFCVASVFFIGLLVYENTIIKKALFISAISFLINGIYYMSWVFWENPDLPMWLYHLILLGITLLISFGLYNLYKYLTNITSSIQVLRGNLDTLDRDIEFIKEIGWQMPEDKKFITYKMLIETTSSNLKETRNKIESILGE